MYNRYIPPSKGKPEPKPVAQSPPPPPPTRAIVPISSSSSSYGATGSITYARYVPQKKTKAETGPTSRPLENDGNGSSVVTKRKHEDTVEAQDIIPPKAKKSKISEDVEVSPRLEEEEDGKEVSKKKKKSKKSKEDGQEESQASSAVHDAPVPSTSAPDDVPMLDGEIEDIVQARKNKEARKEKKKQDKMEKKEKKKSVAESIPEKDNSEDETISRHKAVLAKKSKSLEKAKKAASEPGEESQPVDPNAAAETNTQDVEMHGLEPLPQPEPVALDTSKPTYETLPPWLASPIHVSSDKRTPFSDIGITSKAARALEFKGYKDAFAVQTAAIPLLLPSCKHRQGDILISAATGSGKTLAYALPIVQDISQGVVTRLRALVVLPTRELVKQAQEVFELCAGIFDGRDQKRVQVGIAIGSQPLKYEQAHLLKKEEKFDPKGYASASKKLLDEWANYEDSESDEDLGEKKIALGNLPDHMVDYTSKVDVLICTPGRLVEHINLTPGFSLDYVRWLVVDEADKLLAQSFQGWLEVIMPKLRESKFSARDFPGSKLSGVRKIVLSATLTRDLSLLSGLQLRRPQLIVLEGGQADGGAQVAEHTLPVLLKESAIRVHDANLKPLYLLDLLLGDYMQPVSDVKTLDLQPTVTASDLDDSETSSSGTSSSGSDSESDSESDSGSDSESDSDTLRSNPAKPISFNTTVLIFSKSNESALRLSRLLAILCPPLAPLLGTLTSTTKTSDRRKTLSAFAAGKLRILVASDLIARGIDLPSLQNVVNYDLPASMPAYVHRVGRTARAGRGGSAWTLVADDESGWFWGKIAKGSGIRRSGKVERVRIGDGEGGMAEERVEVYEAALEKLGQEAGEMRRHK